MKKILLSFLIGIFLSCNCYAAQTIGLTTIGDSITAGTAGAGSQNLTGYRQQLQLLLGVKDYAFVGAFSSPTSVSTLNSSLFSVSHCGVGGNTTTQILARETACLTPLNSYSSKIAVILAGINDIVAAVGTSTITANLETIIDNVVTNDAATDIYVMLLVPNETGGVNTSVITQNASYTTMLQGKQGSNSHIHIVDMYTAFTSNTGWNPQYMVNATHPNEYGYGVMAQTLYNCITNHSSTYCDGH